MVSNDACAVEVIPELPSGAAFAEVVLEPLDAAAAGELLGGAGTGEMEGDEAMEMADGAIEPLP